MARQPTALITGGVGGFGIALARRLRARDFNVALADVDVDRGREAADELGALFLPLDVGDLAANHRAVSLAESHFAALDSVFLNAGILSQQELDEPLDMQEYEAILGANLHGVVYGIDAAVPALRRSGAGRIVVTASLAALVPMPGDPLYSLTKSAALAYSRAMAPRLADLNITVSIVCPGFADTPMLGGLKPSFEEAGFPILTADEVAAALLLAHDEGEAGSAYMVQPGLPPTPYRFRNVPAARDAAGSRVALPAELSGHDLTATTPTLRPPQSP